jgi:hypothetical protein
MFGGARCSHVAGSSGRRKGSSCGGSPASGLFSVLAQQRTHASAGLYCAFVSCQSILTPLAFSVALYEVLHYLCAAFIGFTRSFQRISKRMLKRMSKLTAFPPLPARVHSGLMQGLFDFSRLGLPGHILVVVELFLCKDYPQRKS